MHDWTKKKEKMLEIALHVMKIHPGKLPKYSNLEDNLFSWIMEKRENGNRIPEITKLGHTCNFQQIDPFLVIKNLVFCDYLAI